MTVDKKIRQIFKLIVMQSKIGGSNIKKLTRSNSELITNTENSFCVFSASYIHIYCTIFKTVFNVWDKSVKEINLVLNDT